MSYETTLYKQIEKQLDIWCKKSKKICAICESNLKGPSKEDLRNHKGRFWISYLSFRHQKFGELEKSKTYRICGRCYDEIKSSK